MTPGFIDWVVAERTATGQSRREVAARSGRSEAWWRQIENRSALALTPSALADIARGLAKDVTEVWAAAGRDLDEADTEIWRRRVSGSRRVIEVFDLAREIEEGDPETLDGILAQLRTVASQRRRRAPRGD